MCVTAFVFLVDFTLRPWLIVAVGNRGFDSGLAVKCGSWGAGSSVEGSLSETSSAQSGRLATLDIVKTDRQLNVIAGVILSDDSWDVMWRRNGLEI